MKDVNKDVEFSKVLKDITQSRNQYYILEKDKDGSWLMNKETSSWKMGLEYLIPFGPMSIKSDDVGGPFYGLRASKFSLDTWRRYCSDSVYSPVIGFLGIKDNACLPVHIAPALTINFESIDTHIVLVESSFVKDRPVVHSITGLSKVRILTVQTKDANTRLVEALMGQESQEVQIILVSGEPCYQGTESSAAGKYPHNEVIELNRIHNLYANGFMEEDDFQEKIKEFMIKFVN